MLLVLFAPTAPSSIVSAQDDGAAGEFADPVPAAPDPAAADAADQPADAGGAAPPQDVNLLGWVIKSLGWFYLVTFLILSITLVSLFVMNVLAARRDTLCPQELVDDFESKLNEKDIQGAYDLARTDESVLGQVLSAGLAKLSRGYNKALEGMQEVGEEESMKLEHRLSYMALIGNLSPMIGLFGTVHGMISSFQDRTWWRVSQASRVSRRNFDRVVYHADRTRHRDPSDRSLQYFAQSRFAIAIGSRCDQRRSDEPL